MEYSRITRIRNVAFATGFVSGNYLGSNGTLLCFLFMIRFSQIKSWSLRFGVGWDSDIPFRPWPVFCFKKRKHDTSDLYFQEYGVGMLGLFIIAERQICVNKYLEK